MNRAQEDYAWETWLRKLGEQRHRLDGMLPVAAVVMPVCRGGAHQHGAQLGDGHVQRHGPPGVIWPPGDLDRIDLAEILERAAKDLRDIARREGRRPRG